MINRREFLTGCTTALSALVLPQFSAEESVAPLVEELSRTTVKINGVVFEHAETDEVFEHDDYYLHVKIPMPYPALPYTIWGKIPEWDRLYRGLRRRSHTDLSSGKDKVEVTYSSSEMKNEYTCVYSGFTHRDRDSPESNITLYFRLESLTGTITGCHPNRRHFTSYHILRANKLWWSQGDEG